MGKRITAFSAEVGTVTLLVTDCASCGVLFGITSTLEERRRNDHGDFYCPNGHVLVFRGKTKAEEDAERAKQQARQLRTMFEAERDRAEAAMKEAAAAKAAEVRLRWRIGNGVCPCCQRSFPELAAHVATKHPEFAHRDLDALSFRMKELLAAIRAQTEAADAAVVEVESVEHFHWRTAKALVNRGLIDRIGWDRVALTEAGWPMAAAIAGGESR